MGVAAAAAEEAMNNIGGVTMLSYQPTMDRDTEQEAASISLLDHLPPGVPVSSSRAAMLSPMGAMAIITYTGGKNIQRAYSTPEDEEHELNYVRGISRR